VVTTAPWPGLRVPGDPLAAAPPGLGRAGAADPWGPSPRPSGCCALSSPRAWPASAVTPTGTRRPWARWIRGTAPGSTPWPGLLSHPVDPVPRGSARHPRDTPGLRRL